MLSLAHATFARFHGTTKGLFIAFDVQSNLGARKLAQSDLDSLWLSRFRVATARTVVKRLQHVRAFRVDAAGLVGVPRAQCELANFAHRVESNMIHPQC